MLDLDLLVGQSVVLSNGTTVGPLKTHFSDRKYYIIPFGVLELTSAYWLRADGDREVSMYHVFTRDAREFSGSKISIVGPANMEINIKELL